MILLDQAGAGTGGAKLFRPSRALEPLVEHFWAQEVRSSPIGRTWRIVPDSNLHLIFAVWRESSRIHGRCSLVGPRSRFADVTMHDRIFTCGARLRPGTLSALARFPALDFSDRSVPVEDVFGARGRLLLDRLREWPSPASALGIISDFLSGESAGRNRVAPLPLDQCTRVEEMAAQSGLPIRILRSRLMQNVGLSPKRVLRIERLHRAIAGAKDRSVTWAQIAASTGFADQAHMIREFHDLLGESPTAWSRRSRLPISSRQ